MKISMLEWAENLQKMNDKQVQQFAKKKKIDLSLEEIKKLRKIFSKASITWGIYGIPKDVLKEVEDVIGQKRLNQLRKEIGI